MGKNQPYPFAISNPACPLATILALPILTNLTSCKQADLAEHTVSSAPVTPQATFTTPVKLPPTDLPGCAFNPVTAHLLKGTDTEAWLDWVKKLSGAEPVIVNGKITRITSRYSPAMFSGQPNAQAFESVLQTVSEWYPSDQVKVMP